MRAARVARLATHNPSGVIDLVPITFAVVDDLIVTAVDHKPKRTSQLQRLENIRRNPLVTVLVDHYDDDWTQLWWLRVRGDAQVVDALEQRQVDALADKYPQYREHRPTGPGVVIRISGITGWSAEG